jgi:hypothetical protein
MSDLPFRVLDSAATSSAPPSRAEAPLFVDLGDLVRRGLPREYPSIAPALDGRCLLYKGRLNEIHAEPGLGKTNVACAFVVLVVRAGGTALFLDPEDTPHGIAGKLASFGLSDAELSERVRYVHNPGPAQFDEALKWARANPCTLAVCDGFAEALAAEGLNEDVAADVLGFFRNRLRPFAEAGAAVLVSDHVSKNAENRGRWQRGSGAKMGRYDGVSYALAIGEAYRPGRPEMGDAGKAGYVRLLVSKDRLGGVGVLHQAVAHLLLTPDGAATHLEWKEPQEAGEFMPTVLMGKISRHLQTNPSASARELRDLGNSDYVDQAIRQLEKLACLKVTKAGRGKPTHYQLLKPYQEGAK